MAEQLHNLNELVEASGVPAKRIYAACDVSAGTIRNWRNGRAIPAHKLPLLAEVLGVSVADIMGWDTSDEPERTAA